MRLQRILIGVDFSDASARAAEWVARSFAPEAELVLCHVIDIPAPPGPLRDLKPPPPELQITAREGAEMKLRELSRTAKLKRSRFEIRQGEPADTISEIAADEDVDLIVIGGRRDDAGTSNWLGSTAERLLGHALVPVLVVTDPPAGAPTHVLAAVDGSRISSAIESWSHELARRFGAGHTLLAVVSAPVPATLGAARGGASTVVAGTPEPDGIPAEGRDEWISRELGSMAAVSERPEVAFGSPGEEILAAAARHGAGLIVIGRRGAGRARRALFGHVTKQVLVGARCPVLVVVEAVPADTKTHASSSTHT